MHGWAVERSLGAGQVCDSFLVTRGGQRAVARVLRPPFATDAQFCTEWLRACWTANRFRHPRAAQVLEGGTDASGAQVVVRALVEGESLSQALKRAPLEVPLALEIAAQVLDVLEIAHAHGILHAGISPSNVVVTPQGAAWLVDFGHQAEDRIAEARIGPFSAPERRAPVAAPPSETADIWSIGACLRFALGDQPLPADVEAVVALAMAVDPRDRYQSAYSLLGDVRRLLGGRVPKLRASFAPVPSQSLVGVPLALPAPVVVSPPERRAGAPVAPATSSGEWRGNVLLVIAIALLVGLATFVLVRERMADSARHDRQTSQSR